MKKLIVEIFAGVITGLILIYIAQHLILGQPKTEAANRFVTEVSKPVSTHSPALRLTGEPEQQPQAQERFVVSRTARQIKSRSSEKSGESLENELGGIMDAGRTRIQVVNKTGKLQETLDRSDSAFEALDQESGK